MHEDVVPAGRVRKLQRGRAAEGAEMFDDAPPERMRACFNGAAPPRARRYRRINRRWAHRRRFNGAAPPRARRSMRGFEGVNKPSLLQRGRAAEGAEMPGAELPPTQAASLQRGRAAEGAEMQEGRTT